MVLNVGLLDLILFCFHQWGIALGVGAETVMLIAYASAISDGIVDIKEAHFLRIIKGILITCICFIVISGIGLTVIELQQHGNTILFQPAFGFEWVLVALVTLLALLANTLPPKVHAIFAGGIWYSLFVLHILAPVTSWGVLLVSFLSWMVLFGGVWSTVLFLFQRKNESLTQHTAFHMPVSKPVSVIKEEPRPTPKIILDPPQKIIAQVPKPAVVTTPIIVPVIKPETVPPIPKPQPIKAASMSTPREVLTDSLPKKIEPVVPPAPKTIVTDTPFIPKVPALTPIPMAKSAPIVIPIAQPTTVIPEEGLKAFTVMPKSAEQAATN